MMPLRTDAQSKAPEMELTPVSGDPKDREGPQARTPEGQVTR